MQQGVHRVEDRVNSGLVIASGIRHQGRQREGKRGRETVSWYPDSGFRVKKSHWSGYPNEISSFMFFETNALSDTHRETTFKSSQCLLHPRDMTSLSVGTKCPFDVPTFVLRLLFFHLPH